MTTKEEDMMKDVVPISESRRCIDKEEVDYRSPEYMMYRLQPMQIRFVNLYLSGQYNVQELADIFDVHTNTVYKWLRSSNVKKAIKEMQEMQRKVVTANINSLTINAIHKMKDLLDDADSRVQYQAAKDILDRGGHKAAQDINVNKTITYEEKLRNIMGDMIDVEDVEVVEEDEADDTEAGDE